MPKFREFDPFNPTPLNRPTFTQKTLKTVQVAGALMVAMFLADTYFRAADGLAGFGGPQRAATMRNIAPAPEATVPTEIIDQSPLWSAPALD